MIALLFGAVLTLAAQGQPPPPPQPPSPAGAPAGEAAPHPEGHAIITEQVIRADTKQPLRRAFVRVSGAPLTQSIVATTNPRGVYEVRDLLPGRGGDAAGGARRGQDRDRFRPVARLHDRRPRDRRNG